MQYSEGDLPIVDLVVVPRQRYSKISLAVIVMFVVFPLLILATVLAFLLILWTISRFYLRIVYLLQKRDAVITQEK